MDKTQYYIPCINVDDLVAAEYNLTLSKEEENNILIYIQFNILLI